MNELTFNPVTNKFDIYAVPVETIKAHITSPINNPTLNNWTPFSGFEVVSDDSSGKYIEMDANTKLFRVKKSGLFMFGGCVHFINNTAAAFNIMTLLIRVVKNANSEARCSQRGFIGNFGSDNESNLAFGGTDDMQIDDTLELQYYTNENDLTFFSNANFQYQVAASFWLLYLGKRKAPIV